MLQDIGMQAPELFVFNQIDRMGNGKGDAVSAFHPHRPAKAAGAGRRDALGGRRGTSELLALTFESATELPPSMRRDGARLAGR